MKKNLIKVQLDLKNCLIFQGQIAFANVVSDIYACGVSEIDEVKIILSLPEQLSVDDQQVISSEIIEGFRSSAKIAGCRLKIQSVNINPWCIIGGIATSVCTKDEIVFPNRAVAGDVIILTKPLGTQLATNAQIWRDENSESWQKLSEVLTHAQVDAMQSKAVKSMTTLNMLAAKLMRKFNAHAATDITGFGLVGHAENLLQFQSGKIDFIINKFPIIQHVKLIAETLNRMSRLNAGTMVETSGGLFIVLSAEKAEKFCDEFAASTSGSQGCWIIGRVQEGDGKVQLDCPEVIEV